MSSLENWRLTGFFVIKEIKTNLTNLAMKAGALNLSDFVRLILVSRKTTPITHIFRELSKVTAKIKELEYKEKQKNSHWKKDNFVWVKLPKSTVTEINKNLRLGTGLSFAKVCKLVVYYYCLLMASDNPGDWEQLSKWIPKPPPPKPPQPEFVNLPLPMPTEPVSDSPKQPELTTETIKEQPAKQKPMAIETGKIATEKKKRGRPKKEKPIEEPRIKIEEPKKKIVIDTIATEKPTTEPPKNEQSQLLTEIDKPKLLDSISQPIIEQPTIATEKPKTEPKPKKEYVAFSSGCINASTSHYLKGKSHWGKIIERIDLTQKGGFCFVGDTLLSSNKENLVPIGSFVVFYCGRDDTFCVYHISAAEEADWQITDVPKAKLATLLIKVKSKMEELKSPKPPTPQPEIEVKKPLPLPMPTEPVSDSPKQPELTTETIKEQPQPTIEKQKVKLPTEKSIQTKLVKPNYPAFVDVLTVPDIRGGMSSISNLIKTWHQIGGKPKYELLSTGTYFIKNKKASIAALELVAALELKEQGDLLPVLVQKGNLKEQKELEVYVYTSFAHLWFVISCADLFPEKNWPIFKEIESAKNSNDTQLLYNTVIMLKKEIVNLSNSIELSNYLLKRYISDSLFGKKDDEEGTYSPEARKYLKKESKKKLIPNKNELAITDAILAQRILDLYEALSFFEEENPRPIPIEVPTYKESNQKEMERQLAIEEENYKITLQKARQYFKTICSNISKKVDLFFVDWNNITDKKEQDKLQHYPELARIWEILTEIGIYIPRRIDSLVPTEKRSKAEYSNWSYNKWNKLFEQFSDISSPFTQPNRLKIIAKFSRENLLLPLLYLFEHRNEDFIFKYLNPIYNKYVIKEGERQYFKSDNPIINQVIEKIVREIKLEELTDFKDDKDEAENYKNLMLRLNTKIDKDMTLREVIEKIVQFAKDAMEGNLWSKPQPTIESPIEIEQPKPQPTIEKSKIEWDCVNWDFKKWKDFIVYLVNNPNSFLVSINHSTVAKGLSDLRNLQPIFYLLTNFDKEKFSSFYEDFKSGKKIKPINKFLRKILDFYLENKDWTQDLPDTTKQQLESPFDDKISIREGIEIVLNYVQNLIVAKQLVPALNVEAFEEKERLAKRREDFTIWSQKEWNKYFFKKIIDSTGSPFQRKNILDIISSFASFVPTILYLFEQKENKYFSQFFNDIAEYWGPTTQDTPIVYKRPKPYMVSLIQKIDQEIKLDLIEKYKNSPYPEEKKQYDLLMRNLSYQVKMLFAKPDNWNTEIYEMTFKEAIEKIVQFAKDAMEGNLWSKPQPIIEKPITVQLQPVKNTGISHTMEDFFDSLLAIVTTDKPESEKIQLVKQLNSEYQDKNFLQKLLVENNQLVSGHIKSNHKKFKPIFLFLRDLNVDDLLVKQWIAGSTALVDEIERIEKTLKAQRTEYEIMEDFFDSLLAIVTTDKPESEKIQLVKQLNSEYQDKNFLQKLLDDKPIMKQYPQLNRLKEDKILEEIKRIKEKL